MSDHEQCIAWFERRLVASLASQHRPYQPSPPGKLSVADAFRCVAVYRAIMVALLGWLP